MQCTRTNALAAFWGLAEATAFFIVPDVLLSWVALRSCKRALLACLWVTGGALAGGCILWFIGRHDPEPARALFATLPAINDGMIENVRSQLHTSGLKALFLGPLSGTPYKIYAVEAASIGYGLGIFLLISLPARLIRFLLVSLVASGISKLLSRKLGMRHLQTLHVLFWTALYAWYFSVMPGSG
jgi:membrane protein YqaA with SNARE-associated domain